MGANCRTVAGVPSFASLTLLPSLLEVPVELRRLLLFMEDGGRDRVVPFLSKLESPDNLTVSLPGSQLRMISLLRRPSAS